MVISMAVPSKHTVRNTASRQMSPDLLGNMQFAFQCAQWWDFIPVDAVTVGGPERGNPLPQCRSGPGLPASGGARPPVGEAAALPDTGVWRRARIGVRGRAARPGRG